MSEFSNLLYQYVHDKHINISRLARNCGIQTSTFHQYMNGKRALHKDDELERIMRYLQLSPGERSALLEAYDIMQIGPERYAGRKKAEWFIRSLPEIERRRPLGGMPPFPCRLLWSAPRRFTGKRTSARRCSPQLPRPAAKTGRSGSCFSRRAPCCPTCFP